MSVARDGGEAAMVRGRTTDSAAWPTHAGEAGGILLQERIQNSTDYRVQTVSRNYLQ